MRKSMLLVLFVAMALPCIASSATSISFPSAISTFVPIQLTNQQGSAFTQNSQVMLTVNSLAYKSYESGNLQNVEFFYSNGTVIPSWLEGNVLDEAQSANLYTSQNTVYWLRIPPASTFLGAGASNTVYMGFAQTSVSLLGNIITGEAPQLSPIYGEYDNGANIFSTYYNYSGTTTPSGLAVASDGASGSVTFANMVTVTSTNTMGSMAEFLYGTSTISPAPKVIDALFISQSTDSHDKLIGWDLNSPAVQAASSWWGWSNGAVAGLHNNGEILTISSNTPSTPGSSTTTASTPTVVSLIWPSSSVANGLFDYGALQSSSTHVPTIGNSYPVYGFVSDGGSVSYQWGRTRIAPPNEIMPFEAFNAVTVVPTITLANSLSKTQIDLVVGSASDNALITASCASGDTCQIDGSNGVSLASGTQTAVLPYNALPVGYTTLYANDITNSLSSGNVYVRRIVEANALRLTFTNTEPYAEPGNNSLIIRYNASKYAYLESNSLNNTAIAFKNGTVAYSWLEGNSLGEQNPANELSESSNVVYWLRTPPSNTFLTADNGNIVTNSLFLVLGSPTTNLMDGNFIGEAPQLSCPTSNATTCVGGTYAEYDNGASVFTYYTNFAGYNVPAGWDTSETADLVVDNGISFTGAGTGGEEAQMTMNAVYSRPISIDLLAEVLGANPVYDIGYANTIGAFTGGYQISGKDANEFDVYVATPLVDTHDGTPVAYATVTSDVWNPVTLGIGTLSIHDEVGYVPFSTYNDTSDNYYHPFFGSWWTDKTVYAQWFRLRDSYDSNVSLSPPYVTAPNPTPPTITLAGSVSGNTIQVAEGSASDNELITANCYPADVCEIYDSQGTLFATNITFVSIPYNSLPLGNTTIYANDTTASFTSNNAYVDRISSAGAPPPQAGEPSTGGLLPQMTTIQTTTVSSTTLPTTTNTTILQHQIVLVNAGENGSAQLCNATASSYNVSYPNLGSTFHVVSASSSCTDIIAINVTKTASAPAPPTNKTGIIVIDVTIGSNALSANVTIDYPCGTQVAPYLFANGTWIPIEPFSANVAACMISFAIPHDPIIALFAPQQAAATTTILVEQNTNSTNNGYEYAAAAAAAIIVIALISLLSKRKRRKAERKR